jgi:hypothetical protein
VSAATGGERTGRLVGYLAEFETPGALRDACREVRESGYTRWDAHSPYPVHGLDRAMGLRPTLLPWLVFGGGLTGTATALGLQWWTNAHNYPLVISGKPLFSLPANIPIMFELTVLFAALTAVLSVVVFSGLPAFHHPVFTSRRFRRATVDRFFISIEARDPRFEERGTEAFLKSLNPSALERLEV